MTFQPLNDRVTIKRDETEEVSSGGIILADTSQEKPSRGTVVAVGNGVLTNVGQKLIPLDVKPGDEVLFGKWAGTEISIDGDNLLVVKESEIFGIFE